jgi:hypothetical protein
MVLSTSEAIIEYALIWEEMMGQLILKGVAYFEGLN